MPKFEPGTWVWITDDRERYLPARVLKAFSAGEATTVRTEDGEDHALSAQLSGQTAECNPEAMDSRIEDLINISDLNEMSILHNLRIRFKEDKIYTNISSILISVNPFKLLPLYTPEMLDKYRNGARGLPPHVFASAYNAYNNMLSEGNDQSVVISGESGAGKSEATKLILQFLTDVSSRTGGHSNASASLEQQILAANPILEAFGNAKTLRNNNSSRFGKLITVNFDKNGSIVGGGIINYLLEKSRVVSQTKGERNYHIFYQLLSAAASNPQLTAELKLQEAAMFDFTNPGRGGVTEIEGHYDDKEFEETQNSMDILRFGAEMKHEVLKIVAGVLHFGNLKFRVEKKDAGDDGSSVANPEVVAHASAMWGVSSQSMSQFLTNRTMATGGDRYNVAYNVQQAQDARDAMVKRVYAELFQVMVNKINAELSSTGLPRHKFIGVLDIFGCESFEVNSFEQLCINFCNEKLQFHFNEHIFKMEQSLYLEEGIVIPGSTFVDNQPTLDLLELKGTGIFSMTDEECLVPKGSDGGLLAKVLKKEHPNAQERHPNLLRPKAKECKDHTLNFGILHYAGPVFYNVTNFLDKNKDQLHPDIVGVLRSSESAIIRNMFPPDPVEPQAGSRASVKMGVKQLTLGGQFKNQLNDLIATLNSTFPHFVRCMKSNDRKQGNIFESGRMQDQLRYAGLVEVCRIRKLGYPVRRTFVDFFRRFRCCNLLSPSHDDLLAFLASQKVLVQGEWAKGKSRVFMRTAQAASLELYREQALVQVAVVVQKYGRRMLARFRMRRFKTIIANVREATKKRLEEALTEAIDMTFELPWNGSQIEAVRTAKAMLVRVKEENQVFRLIENAMATCDLNGLKSAIAAAAQMSPPLKAPLVDQAQALAAKLEAEHAVKAGLSAAISARDMAALVDCIARANGLKMSCPELAQAMALKARLEEETKTIAALKEACQRKDIASISTFLGKCVELGISAHPEAVEAEKIKTAIMSKESSANQEKIKQQERDAAKRRGSAVDSCGARLATAMSTMDLGSLNMALQEAMQQGLPQAEIQAAQALIERLHLADDARSLIAAALSLLTVRAAAGITNADLEPLRAAIVAAEKIAATTGDFSELVGARAALVTYGNHIKARVDMDAAVAAKDRVLLRAALDLAENSDMDIPSMAAAKALMRDLQAAYRAECIAAGKVPDDDEPYDAAEEARKRRQEQAKQAKYDVKNFDRLRTADDFAKGALMNKAKVKEQFLTFQSTKILKSLSNLSVRDSKTALEVFLDLLGYMGDKQMPFPAMLAQDVLRKGSECKTVRDEIYLQVIKQLSCNPRPESVAKGWQIMCMCVGTFPPSPDFEFYLMHYIIEKSEKGRGAVVDYARYCLRTLEAMLSHSHGDATGFVPQVDEILAYKERPPILATIYLVDGKPIAEDLPITPDVNVGKVLELCTHWLTLSDPRIATLGIFVYDMGEVQDERYANDPLPSQPYNDLERTPRPLRSEDYMGCVSSSSSYLRTRPPLHYLLSLLSSFISLAPSLPLYYPPAPPPSRSLPPVQRHHRAKGKAAPHVQVRPQEEDLSAAARGPRRGPVLRAPHLPAS